MEGIVFLYLEEDREDEGRSGRPGRSIELHKPKYDWGKLWAGMEQVHEILKLLLGLHQVGSTDPVADAVALGKDKVLREAIAKTVLDLMIYPVAISLDRCQSLMRVRRHMKPDEVEVWLSRRGYRFATSDELCQFLTQSHFWGAIVDFHERVYGQRQYSELGYSTEKGVHERTSGCDSIDCYMDNIGFFLAVKEDVGNNIDPIQEGSPVAVEPIGQCKRCGSDVSGWTHECPQCGARSYWPKK